MYEHLVLFKFNSSFNPQDSEQLVQELLTFKGEIPGILELTAGVNVSEEKQNIHGYTLGLRITFDSQEALRQYIPHPKHQAFVAKLDEILDHVVVADYPVR